MKLLKNIFFLSLAVLSIQTNAQQLPVISQYLYNPYLYNPARTGDGELGSINLNFKRQWTSMPYAPITGMLSVESPIKNTDMGVGGMLYSDRTHIINRIGGMGSYAYHIPFSKDYLHSLSAGLSLGFIHQSFDFEAADVENPNDVQLLNSNARGTSFDFSLGLNYRWKDLQAGFSMLQGLNNQIKFLSSFGQEVKYINSRHFMLNTSYNFRVGKDKEFLIRPVVMTRFIPALPVQVEVNVVGNWKSLVWASLGYRSSNWQTATSAITSSVGVELNKRIFIAYNFEITPSAYLLSSLGTQHEFMMSCRFGKNDEFITMKKQLAELIETNKMMLSKIDSNSNNVKKATDRLNKKLSELETTTKQANEDLKKTITDQTTQMKLQQDSIGKHRKEIEELREEIKKKPLKYKKMGEINFSNASSELSAIEKSKIDAFSAELKNMPNSMIYLYGNASTDGNAAQNMDLSSKRCIAVRKYLIEKGVSADKITVLPMGQENTLSGTTAVSASDRRVDVVVMEK